MLDVSKWTGAIYRVPESDTFWLAKWQGANWNTLSFGPPSKDGQFGQELPKDRFRALGQCVHPGHL